MRLLALVVVLAWQLIHSPDVERIPDRNAFIKAYEAAASELTKLSTPGEPGYSCIIS